MPRPPDGEKSLTRYEITKKYREKMLTEGFKQVSIWIQSDLLEKSRAVSDKEGKTLSELISDALAAKIVFRGNKDALSQNTPPKS